MLILLAGALVAVVLWTAMAQRHGRPPGRRGDERLGRRSAREIAEDRAALEAEDLAQMLAVHNARRRRRGQAERTLQDVELLVAADGHRARGRREALVAESELDQLLAAVNARRRARGLPERTREEIRVRDGSVRVR